MNKLLKEIVRLAQETPNFIYGEGVERPKPPKPLQKICLYTAPKWTPLDNLPEDTSCGCIVGRALCNVYPESVDKLRSVDLDPSTNVNAGRIIEILKDKSNIHIECTLNEKSILQHIQGHQDDGKTWACSVLEGFNYNGENRYTTLEQIVEAIDD